MSGYIMDLRQIVGHRTLIQCAASVIIVDGAGRLLLGKRTDNHLWGYSGGSMEIDEKAEDCAKRELFEETGLTAHKLEFFMVNSGPETHYVYPNGDEVSNTEIIYVCRKYTGALRPQEDEVEELRWFNPAEISADMISPPIRPVFSEYFMRFGIDRKPTEIKVFASEFTKVYDCLIAKLERKGHTRAELDDVTSWLTGYTARQIAGYDDTYGEFLKTAPAWNQSSRLITGAVCGIKVQEIKDPLVYRMRCLDKLADDIAKGKPVEKMVHHGKLGDRAINLTSKKK